MKKKALIMAAIMLLAAMISSCAKPQTDTVGSSQNTEKAQNATQTTASDAAVAYDSPTQDDRILVVYFSATGTTKAAAERIAAYTNADLYEIQPKTPYTDADLDWTDKSSRTTKEQNDKKIRPEIGSDSISIDGYSTIFIGYPIWWGEEPRIIDTFVETYDFADIKCIPFCTSGGSGVGRSDANLKKNAGSGNWQRGKLLNGISDDELHSWIDSVR